MKMRMKTAFIVVACKRFRLGTSFIRNALNSREGNIRFGEELCTRQPRFPGGLYRKQHQQAPEQLSRSAWQRW
ncbi:hypothetical protein FKM82_001342 [Ascaphus truei]